MHNINQQNNILVRRWHNVHNLGTVWYNIYHIIQQVLCNIQELYTMALPSATAISLAFHLQHIMQCSV